MTTITSYKVQISGETLKDFTSFEDAFKHLYKQICRRIDEYSITMSDVTNKCSLTDPSGKRYDYLSAIKEATDKGFFKNGKLVERTSVRPISESVLGSQ